ncbi:MAG TPA: flagellar biosynthesis anti-sigma factor FlgM [Lachnospiraceae bacterium]|nr:flagellar biosynthesis anti-sigma factor FlgM [Lachnospiraceae bacterium]HPF29273.1 flagellar biosynthesis anti-sigma factor FlgM [Lachnospiraceae bacterium]
MRIEAYSQIQQMYNASKPVNKAANATKADFKDKLQISGVGKDLQVAKQAVANAPDVREEKIAAIKRNLENGTYEVSSEDFAERIMEKYGQTLA